MIDVSYFPIQAIRRNSG